MPTLQSLAQSRYDKLDVMVVDQSLDGATESAFRQTVGNDRRFRYVRSSTAGLSRARNELIALTDGDVVAFTDDDCVVAPDWIHRIVRSFDRRPNAGLVFGEVRAARHDPALGLVPVAIVPARRHVSSPWLKWRDRGIGANMALRRDVLRRVGGFDPILGAGAPLGAGEDFDMAYRVLRAGFEVLDVPDAVVVHHGFRNWEQVRRLMPASGLGAGAAYMKHLRLGDLAVLPTLVLEWTRCISWRRLMLLRRGSGVGLFMAFGRGLASSLGHDVDAISRVYIS